MLSVRLIRCWNLFWYEYQARWYLFGWHRDGTNPGVLDKLHECPSHGVWCTCCGSVLCQMESLLQESVPVMLAWLDSESMGPSLQVSWNIKETTLVFRFGNFISSTIMIRSNILKGSCLRFWLGLTSRWLWMVHPLLGSFCSHHNRWHSLHLRSSYQSKRAHVQTRYIPFRFAQEKDQAYKSCFQCTPSHSSDKWWQVLIMKKFEYSFYD